jgi:hypothetical protein
MSFTCDFYDVVSNPKDYGRSDLITCHNIATRFFLYNGLLEVRCKDHYPKYGEFMIKTEISLEEAIIADVIYS